MSRDGANGAAEVSLQAYTGPEQENLLRTRLLTEDRPFRRIIRKVTLLTTPELRTDESPNGEGSSSSSKLVAALGSVQIELAALAHTAKRFSFLARTALPAQCTSYQAQASDLDAAIAAHEADILTLKAELELVQRERSNKLIYDNLARQINALPTRTELNEHLDRLSRDNAALHADGRAYDELDQSARARFRAQVLEPLEELQKHLGEQVGRRERSAVERAQERGEDVDTEVAALEAEAAREDAAKAAAAAAAAKAAEEPEPGEVEEGEAGIENTAGPSISSRSRGSAAAAAARTSLRASAPDFTPGSKSAPSQSRKRPRTASASAAAVEEEGEINDDDLEAAGRTDGGPEASSGKGTLASQLSKGQSGKTVVAIDDDTASSLTSLDDLPITTAAADHNLSAQGPSSLRRAPPDDTNDEYGEDDEGGDGDEDDAEMTTEEGDSPPAAASAASAPKPRSARSRRGPSKDTSRKSAQRKGKKPAAAAAPAPSGPPSSTTGEGGGGGGRRGRTGSGKGSEASAPGRSGNLGGGGRRSASPQITTSAPARKRRK